MKAIAKFVGLGALTTIASYSVYLITLQYFSPMIAYWCALCVAFSIQVAMMAPFVFNEKLTIKNAGKSLLIYAGYSLSFAGLMWLALKLNVPAVWAPLAVVAIASPVQFVVGKKWIHNPVDDIRS
ncbi:GtrA family protein [Thalassospira australica]|uniref:GtrA family protein n=1 Tax=Thalassospira australica TaxID=1528106 RepID=UPI00051A34FE|nr:GtrA family protein [Thalassospira australica]